MRRGIEQQLPPVWGGRCGEIKTTCNMISDLINLFGCSVSCFPMINQCRKSLNQNVAGSLFMNEGNFFETIENDMCPFIHCSTPWAFAMMGSCQNAGQNNSCVFTLLVAVSSLHSLSKVRHKYIIHYIIIRVTIHHTQVLLDDQHRLVFLDEVSSLPWR